MEGSLAMVTALTPLICYDAAAEIVHEAVSTGKSVRQLAQLKKVLPQDQLDSALKPWSMTMPGREEHK